MKLLLYHTIHLFYHQFRHFNQFAVTEMQELFRYSPPRTHPGRVLKSVLIIFCGLPFGLVR